MGKGWGGGTLSPRALRIRSAAASSILDLPIFVGLARRCGRGVMGWVGLAAWERSGGRLMMMGWVML